MRRFPALVALILVAIGPQVANASSYVACWVEKTLNPITLIEDTVTRCRLAGGEIVDYRRDSEVPVVLYPNLGGDLEGVCWFLTSIPTYYIVLSRAANGEALIAYDPTPGGNPSVVPIGSFRRCTSEPRVEVWQEGRVWDYATQYIHSPPRPTVSPDVGLGVTGLPTYLQVDVPEPHSATIGEPGDQLDVEIRVSAVVVDWGDRTARTYPPDRALLTGYPSGLARHVFGVKNAELVMSVSYTWDVRWRVGGGPWYILQPPNSTTTLGYPVAEIVSVLKP